ncbi:DUF2642 domain-containing protein [Bacillus sp. EB600]|uniref:DUF2642 domain-containing protein n=1 Tax=Bacillus sp. EB600 TaxID=2806345 RepID=UPI002810C108|nr:DUF2642 domain-containing protein [Bacillus sp. EB600]
MLLDFLDLKGRNIEVEISGWDFHKGILIDSGPDIVVIYEGRTNSFLYIPFVHIHRLKEISILEEDTSYDPPSEKPIEADAISFHKTLMTARGLFVKVCVTENNSIPGYVTSIMNDYFVFHSPAFKTMLISVNHVKCLIPYPANRTPYTLDNQCFPLSPSPVSLENTFEEQLKKLESQIVILDGGDNPEKIGLLQKVSNNKAILITADGETVYRNLDHIKTIQLP